MKIFILKIIIIFSNLLYNINLNSQSWYQQGGNDHSDESMNYWRTLIDSTWGEGLPIEKKLMIFDSVWTTIDEKFACFQNLNIDWAALRDMYRPEIEQGMSRGRFAAIMNKLALNLQETHTIFYDSLVNIGTRNKKINFAKMS